MSTGAYAADKAAAHPDRLKLLREGKHPYPMHLHLVVSDLCSLDCPACAYRLSGYSSNQLFSGPNGERNPNRMLELPLVKSVLADCVAMGIHAVEFSILGSERIPVIAPDGALHVLNIGTFVDRFFDHPASKKAERRDLSTKGWRAFAIDDEGRVRLDSIDMVYRHPAPEPLYEVTLADGRRITVTGSHSLNVVREGQIEKVPVRDIHRTDAIACAPWHPTGPMALTVPPAYDPAKNAKDTPDDVPLTPELARLLGYFTAEGSALNVNALVWCFGNGPREADYRRDVVRCVRAVFGLEAKIDGSRVYLFSVRARRFFEKTCKACGVQASRHVPLPVWWMPDDLKLEYLRGLFSGDGNFRASLDSRGYRRNSLHLKTCNRILAEEVATLIRDLGARVTITEGRNRPRRIEGRMLPETAYFAVNVYDATSLTKLQGVLDGLGAKRLYEDSIFSRAGKPHRHDTLPFGAEAAAVGVKSIRVAEELKRPVVYDITVRGTHRFLTANGIGCWNTGGGEATLHPDIREILGYAQALGLDTALVTHGLLLARRNLFELAAQTAWTRVSIDAATESVYGAVRPSLGGPHGENLRTALRNLEVLRNTRDLHNTACVIGTGFVVQKENWQQIYEAAKLYRNWGADNIRISGAFTPSGDAYHEAYYDKARELEQRAIADFDGKKGFRVYGRFAEKVDDLHGPPDYSTCSYQRFTTYLGGDGNLYRCCVTSYNRHGLLGNVREAGGLKALWDQNLTREKLAHFDARSCQRCQFNDRNRAINGMLRADAPPDAPSGVIHPNFV